jgi:hypothetical protein
MMRLDPPKRFSFKAEEWPLWISEFKRFRNASKLKDEAGDVQRDTLLYVMGPDAEKVFRSLHFGTTRNADEEEVAEQDTDFDTLVQKLDSYFVVKKNVIYERSQLQQRRQQQGETVEEFYRALRELAKHCNYQDEEDQIRDRLVVGLLDSHLRERLQLQTDLTLDKALKMSRQYEQIKNQSKQGNASTSAADETKFRPSASHSRGRGYNRGHGQQPRPRRGGSSSRPPGRGGREENESGQCGKCGYKHESKGKCPAQGQICRKCNKKNHFKRMCRSGVHEVVTDSEEEQNDEQQEFQLDAVVTEKSEPWMITLRIKDTDVRFKIDTGADISIMSEQTFRTLQRKPKLNKSDAVLTSPGGRLTVRGEFYAQTNYKENHYKFKVIVVASRVGNNLLSRSVAAKMGLVTRVEEVHRNVFGSTGLLHTDPVPIRLKEDAEPYCVTTARRVPFPLQKAVKAELERMQSAGIIQEVVEPSDWCAPMVPVVKKNGSIRICVDYKRLNKAVKRPHCLIPNLEDIAPKMAGSTVFSTLDAASGFFQIPLAEDSKKFTTFMTPFGRFCFKRVPMGISLGPEVFQHTMKETLQGLQGCETIMDDTIVFGRTMEEHDRRLDAVLERIEKSGLKLNKSKCHLRQKEVKYFGHLISQAGVSPDPDKVKAIRDMPPPTNVSELRTLCGMLNYLTKFVPHMASTLKPITNLLQKNMAWCWGPAQQQAFEAVKQKISQSPALGFYSPDRKTVVSADSSSYGLGATLMQWIDGNLVPIAYASRTLTEAERRYSQIEKECLASVFACEKFSKYLIGLDKFELETDHKPLVPLMSTKDIDCTPIRCQRLLLRLMRFNFEVRHVPGKELVIADALSRSPVPHSPEDEELSDEVTAYVDSVMTSKPVTTRRMEALRAATVHDPELQKVINYTLNGWPSTVAEQFRPYQIVQGELSLADGLLVYNDRIVVPVKERKMILQKLHETHQGLNKCRQNAQATVWWPELGKQLKDLVNSCSVCREERPAQKHEPLRPTELPQRPWQQLGADLCSHEGKDYLVVTDYYSRWLEVRYLQSTTSTAVINKFRLIFATHGIPEVIISDNGPQFQCRKFKDFAEEYDFEHRTSSPGFPQANGEAEAGVKIAKKILKQKDPDLALLNYRNTPHSSTGVSPAVALMGRSLRTKIPTLPKNLSPQSPDDNYIRKKDARTKENYRQDYDRRKGATALSPLQPGDNVLLGSSPGETPWKAGGTVVAADTGNRTYLVNTPGGVFRRNRQHLQQLQTPKQVTFAPLPVQQGQASRDPQDITPACPDSKGIEPADSDQADQSTEAGRSPTRPVTRASKGYIAKVPIRYRQDELISSF